jgi:chemotaxis protein methyltransferase CheR
MPWVDGALPAARVAVLDEARPLVAVWARDPAATPVGRGPAPDAGSTWATVLDLVRAECFAEALRLVESSPAEPWHGRTEALVLRAALLVHTGRVDHAAAACREVLDLDGLNAGAHYVLASCGEAGDDVRAAVHHHSTAAYLDAGFAMPRLRLGLLARQRGDVETARRELGRALALLPHEEPQRIVLFGGGFTRHALVRLCRAELVACGGVP